MLQDGSGAAALGLSWRLEEKEGARGAGFHRSPTSHFARLRRENAARWLGSLCAGKDGVFLGRRRGLAEEHMSHRPPPLLWGVILALEVRQVGRVAGAGPSAQRKLMFTQQWVRRGECGVQGVSGQFDGIWWLEKLGD